MPESKPAGKPFSPAHSKKYDVLVDGQPLRMKSHHEWKDASGALRKFDYNGSSHALAIYYMCTVPSEKEIPILEESIVRRKEQLQEMRDRAAGLKKRIGTYQGEESFSDHQSLSVTRVNIRYSVGEIILMEERLEDVKQYLAGNWQYEVYERTD